MNKKQCGQNCPYSKFEFDDLLYSSLGNYECKIKGIEYGQYGEPTGNYICHEEKHKECFWFDKENNLEKGSNKK